MDSKILLMNKNSLEQQFIQKLGDIIETNILNNQFGVSELAKESGLSRSQLHRRLKNINGKSSSQFIKEYRLLKAMEMLKDNVATVSEISFLVGFTSPSYFNTCFNEYYGFPPGEVKFRMTEAFPVLEKKSKNAFLWITPLLLLAGLLFYYVYFNKSKLDVTQIEKSIAVLPFINDSPNQANLYFCNGIMAGIRDQLAKIPDLIVVSRVSTDQYRGNPSELKKIAEELGVNYLVEGRVQRIDNKAIISVELIYAVDNTLLWSDRYNKDVSEIFKVQSDVIASISNNLEAIISPNLKNQLDQIPTNDELAYDHYLKGEEYRFKANRSTQKIEVWLNLLDKAQLSYELAIEGDSLFAQAYIGMAQNVNDRKGPYMLEEHRFEEVLIHANKALQINPNLSNAYAIRGAYYLNINQIDLGKNDFESALGIDPNNGIALHNLSVIYRLENKYEDAIIALKKMEKLVNSEEDLMKVYRGYRFYYGLIDDLETDEYYLNKISQIDSTFSGQQLWFYFRTKQFDKAIAYMEKTCPEDNQQKNGFLASIYSQMGDKDAALKYFENWYHQVINEGVNCWVSTLSYAKYGHVLIALGEKQLGIEMLQKQIEVFDKMIASGEAEVGVYYDLVGIYGILGEYDKAYENMKIYENTNGWIIWGGMTSYVKYDVQFNALRNDAHFLEWIKNGERQVADLQNRIRPYLTSTVLD